ncbi:RING/U-box superfamily protein, putative isoform 3 [Hibiscus syriacus]|uniref:RING/U-box superfamily protein, putative isoform 3 n=1 Tax=Hibiscus syriacus TaxID=106335 RepID=A0A6A2Z8E3_HIBSY|nr:RING/U-box superfamily protein, putative isoform 3 [Hibiscus syriacus]
MERSYHRRIISVIIITGMIWTMAILSAGLPTCATSARVLAPSLRDHHCSLMNISELASSNGLNVDSVSSSRRQSLVSRNVLNANSVSSSRSQSLVLSNGLNADRVSSSRRQSLRSNERLARARFDEGTSELLSSNGLNVDGVSNVSGRSLSADERLPGAVLLARARLLERLRGVSVSANRRSSRTPRNAYRWEYVSDDDLRTVSEISTVLTARSTRLTSETERFQLLHETSKKPPGLTQEAVDRLVSEVFSSQEVDVERKTSRDCGICLESFREDDVLTRLPCGHRFHFGCLDPWVRTWGLSLL